MQVVGRIFSDWPNTINLNVFKFSFSQVVGIFIFDWPESFILVISTYVVLQAVGKIISAWPNIIWAINFCSLQDVNKIITARPKSFILVISSYINFVGWFPIFYLRPFYYAGLLQLFLTQPVNTRFSIHDFCRLIAK